MIGQLFYSIYFLLLMSASFMPLPESPEYPEGKPNLHVFEMATGKVVDERIHVPIDTW